MGAVFLGVRFTVEKQKYCMQKMPLQSSDMQTAG